MSEISADAQAWLKAKSANRKIFTRSEINWIDAIAAGKANTKQAADDLGVSRNTINTWLRIFGYRRRATYTRGHNKPVVPWNSPLRCSRCGILLQYADWQRDGLCDWCIEMEQRVPDVNAEIDYVLEQEVNRG